jgi:acylpyruvate hydrolase
MRLGAAVRGGRRNAFVDDGERCLYFEAGDVRALLVDFPDWAAGIGGAEGPFPAEVDLLTPVEQPAKIVCVGLNYRSHTEEVGKVPPTTPTLFAKVATALTGPTAPIVLPRNASEIDWEAELAIVIGRSIRHASREAARDAILGYSILNDVSARDWQRRTSEWFQGKNFDNTTPFGPAIVTADSIDPMTGLAIECWVNGELRQSGSTTDMIFDPVDLICYITQFLTLQPGDVISSGTPGGVGMGAKPPQFLQPGYEVVTRIEGIGELVNTCVLEEPKQSAPDSWLVRTS